MSAELRIPRDPAFVGLARLVVAQAARLAGVPQDRVQDVKIAVAEAVASLTGTDRSAAVEAEVELRFGMTTAGFEVVVTGPAGPVNGGDDHEALEVLDPKLGFTLIEGLTDDFEHTPDGDTQRLRFVVGAA